MTERLARLSAALSDRYTLDRELGAGGMATVYLATDRKHDRQVAVKVLRPEIAVALGPERFLQEIQIAASLNHPHILALHDSGEADGFLYYVMPHVEGESLRERLNREKQLGIEDALRLTEQIASALGYAHGQGIIHRDIKPENILLHEGVAMVADFGIALAVSAAGGERLTETGLSVGTPEYMSPEQGTGEQQIDNRSDIYSLGCVLYEMLASEPPFTGPTAQAVIAKRAADPPPTVRRVRHNVTEPVDKALQKVLAQVPADRFAQVSEFARALRAKRAPPPRRRLVTSLIAAAVATLGVSVALAVRGRGGVDLNPDRIAVAPFDVLAPGLELWREGLVDVLSASLDGAGPLRTVPPSVVIKRWTGRADQPSALQLGADHGARFVVFGRLQPAGPDSARLNVVLYDVGRSHAVEEFELRDASERVDRLADSTAVRLLAAVNSVRPIGAVPLQSLGSSSPAALKAFLQGEQHYRRSSFDSAAAFYQEASALDSTFALALNRQGWALQYGEWGNPLPVDSLMLRAGRNSLGLARRESLQVTADSLYSALGAKYRAFRADTALLFRLHATLERATREYPDDPQLWMTLGEARTHWPIVGSTDSATITAFARGVQADSTFAPAYFHLIERLLKWDEPAEVRNAIEAFLALNPPPSDYPTMVRVLRTLLDAPRPADKLEPALDTLSVDVLTLLIPMLWGFPETSELVMKASRLRLARAPPDLVALYTAWSDGASAYRGHIREPAVRADPSSRFGMSLFADLALLGAVPREAASAVFAGWAQSSRPEKLYLAYAWFAATGDTSGLQNATRGLEDAVRTGDVGPSWGARLSAGRDALLAHYRGDATEALQMARDLPRGFPPDELEFLRARILSQAGEVEDAARLLDRSLSLVRPSEVLWVLQRGRVHDALGNTDRAIRAYSYVATIWVNADPELQPYVEEAREALARLGAEAR